MPTKSGRRARHARTYDAQQTGECTGPLLATKRGQNMLGGRMQDQDNFRVKKTLTPLFQPHEIKAASVKQERQSEQSRLDKLRIRLREISTTKRRGEMTKTVLCSYCVLGLEFRPMVAHLDGRYICDKCGHTVHPDDVKYRCRCPKCVDLALPRDRIAS